ncbi:hypothetical protein FO519_001509 [Halicephalobus sp. NKZ332]|nr:hypothetical protein FO519_001509 [Halicephalobus sp. NKZ332]
MPIKINVVLAGHPLEVQVFDNTETTEQDASSDVICRTVGELRTFVNENSKFDGHSMKLIYKGKMISMDASEDLQKYGLKNGDKIMGLGKPKVVPVEDIGLQKLKRFEKDQLSRLAQTYDEIKTDMELLEKNFLNAQMTEEMIARLMKRVLHFIDTSEKHLSAIDGIQIFDDDTPEPVKQQNREFRKTMINGIQDYLNFNDKFKFRLEQLKGSLKYRE